MTRKLFLILIFIIMNPLLFSLIFLQARTPSRPGSLVEVKTNKGSITLLLYDDTPIHRDNFLRLVEAKAYDNVIFHRVIRGFMVQAGGNVLGGSEESAEQLDAQHEETLPAEILYPTYFHHRGALAAARTGDDVNPERRSSSFHFYIVTGKAFLDFELDKIAAKRGVELPTEVKERYLKEGGAPHLDGGYTVFGEVVKGMKTVVKIENTPTDDEDQPAEPIYIKSVKFLKRRK